MTALSLRPARPRRTSERSPLWRLDWVLLLAVLTLAALGAVLVYSATRNDAALTGGEPEAFLQRHLINTAIGLVLGAMVTAAGWDALLLWAPVLYAGALGALVVVLSPLGSTVNGAQSWITLPAGFTLQPAEVAKVGIVLAMAVYLGGADRRAHAARGASDPAGPSRRQLVVALLIAGTPTAFVLLQPDLGTVMVLGAMTVTVLVVAGLRARWLVALSLAGCAVVALAIRVGVLRDYQLARFAAFTDPGLDPLGVGYNTAQARIALRSGGLWGEGLFEGARTRGSYVPEQHTDFIFTVAGEELGFAGGALVIALLGVVLWRCVEIGLRAPDLAGRLVAAGVTGWFAFQAFQNIGMTLGIMPVTGLPLPFVSYGGSSMFASLIAVGMLQAVRLTGSGSERRTPV